VLHGLQITNPQQPAEILSNTQKYCSEGISKWEAGRIEELPEVIAVFSPHTSSGISKLHL